MSVSFRLSPSAIPPQNGVCIPLRCGYRPVMMAVRVGEHTCEENTNAAQHDACMHARVHVRE
jgi:hypothetical protein